MANRFYCFVGTAKFSLLTTRVVVQRRQCRSGLDPIQQDALQMDDIGCRLTPVTPNQLLERGDFVAVGVVDAVD